MDTVKYDLYLDESGSFEKAGEHTLVGGVLIPHEKNPSISEFRRWETEIRGRISESGCFTEKDLAAGDEWIQLGGKLQRTKALNPEETARYEMLKTASKYVFGHCTKNETGSARWKTQGWVLGEYMKKLNAIGGVPVIFDNPNGIYHIDSNTTFMAVFASGIVQLYAHLMNQNPGKGILLLIHAASRLNVTKKNETDKYTASPFAGINNVLEKALYTNQIRNYVFLNGGSDLLELECFDDSIRRFDVIEDFQTGNQKMPNPATVICDYVCNSYLHIEKRGYREIFEKAGICCYLVLGEKPDLSESSVLLMQQNHDWFSFLKLLVSRKFPEKETTDFFRQMNADSGYDQIKCVNSLVEYLTPFVANRENMKEWEERLWMIIDSCTPFQLDAYNILKANILIFLHSLQTHMGKDTKKTLEEFTGCVREIRSVEQRDYLLILCCNRQIVTETDCFRYKEGESWFEAVKGYMETAIRNSDELMGWFSLLTDGGEEVHAQSVQYGKALGSYVQMLTKELRGLTGRERELKLEKAMESARLAFGQFSQAVDIGRAHQNACDLMTEAGEYDKAMNHLYQSISDEEKEGFETQAKAVLEACGSYGEKPKMLFTYLHFVTLMHRCFREKNPKGQIMLDLLLKDSYNETKIAHLIGGAHPQAVILWHLAASLGSSENGGRLAMKLFDLSMLALDGQGELFQTIRMAVHAEMIALGLEGKLPGKKEDWQKEAARYCERLYPSYSKNAIHNPFMDLFRFVEENNAALFYSAADRVAY